MSSHRLNSIFTYWKSVANDNTCVSVDRNAKFNATPIFDRIDVPANEKNFVISEPMRRKEKQHRTAVFLKKILLRSIDNVAVDSPFFRIVCLKFLYILIKVSHFGGAFIRGDQQSQPQSVTRSYDIMLQKHMTRQQQQQQQPRRQRPALGSKAKIMEAKCEPNDNNTEFGVNQATVSQRYPMSNRSVVDSTNRSASGLL